MIRSFFIVTIFSNQFLTGGVMSRVSVFMTVLRRFLKKDIPLNTCLKTDGYPRLPLF